MKHQKVSKYYGNDCRLPGNADYDNATTISASIGTTYRLILSYKGEQGQKIIMSVNNYVNSLLPENHAAKQIHKSWKLRSSFNIKDKTKLEYKLNIRYLVKCPENTLPETYLGEIDRRLNGRIMEHASKEYLGILGTTK